MNREEIMQRIDELDENSVYSAEQLGELFGRTGQAIRVHARKDNLGMVLNHNYRVYTKKDARKISEHIGRYGDPNIAVIYREWPRHRFLDFVQHNYRDESGYEFSDKFLASRYAVSEAVIHGLRRRYKSALRILVSKSKAQANDPLLHNPIITLDAESGKRLAQELLTDLIMNQSESWLRKEGRKYEALP